jgi:hypothetical protein
MNALLKGRDISILDDFLDNWDVVTQFNQQFYKDGFPKTVLCGINPGRLGAGKTGIPFIDFASLSQMVKSVNRDESERSAQFFFDVVQELGIEEFYRNFYVTNVSWVGYTHNHRNVNYDQLPDDAKKFVYDMFQWEMQQVAPSTIISLGGVVKNTVDELFAHSHIEINNYLPHPNYCAFPKNYEKCKAQYIELLSAYMTS